MSKSATDYLQHILQECTFLLSLMETGLTKEALLKDEVMKRAVVRSLEIIGEATKKIPADVKVKWDTVQWKNIAGMRDKLIHDYVGVDYTIVWDVIKNRIPDLAIQIQRILENVDA